MFSDVTGVVLAGGENSRINTPKPLLKVGGIRIIDRQLAALREVFGDMLVVSGTPEIFADLGVRVVPDDPACRGVRGPLAGVYTAIRNSGSGCFVVACDMPFINPVLIEMVTARGLGHDVAVPFVRGFAEPLFGLYAKSALPAMERELTRGGGRVQNIFGALDVRFVEEDEIERVDPGMLSFVNVNTPADLSRAQELAADIQSEYRAAKQ